MINISASDELKKERLVTAIYGNFLWEIFTLYMAVFVGRVSQGPLTLCIIIIIILILHSHLDK